MALHEKDHFIVLTIHKEHSMRSLINIYVCLMESRFFQCYDNLNSNLNRIMKKTEVFKSSGSIYRLRILSTHLFALFILLFLVINALTGCQRSLAIIPNSGLSTLRVVIDNNYPPYTFLDKNGNLQGILIDRWRLWEKKTGIKVEITGLDWSEAQARMLAGEFDVIDTIFVTENRVRLYDFSKPYENIEVPIYFNNKISGIVDADSLKGFSVAVKSNDAAIEYLTDHGVTNLVEYDSYESIIQAASRNEVVVFVVDKPPADYFLYQYGIEQEFNSTESLYGGQFHRAVLKGNSALLAIVENGFSQISETELEAIDEKWYGTSVNTEAFFRYVEVFGIVCLAVLLILIVWNRSLQAQVNKKTKGILESEQKFRQIFETTAVGMTIINDKGMILSGNSAILNLFGYSLEEYCQLSISQISHPEDVEKIKKQYREIWAGEKSSFKTEKRQLHKDGTYILGNVTISIVKDASDSPLFAIEMFEDISERKQTEKIRDSIYEISQATISSSSLDELYGLIHQILSEIMPVDNFYIALYDPEKNLLNFPFFIDEFEETAEPIEPGHGLSDYVMRMGKPLLATEEIFDKLLEDGEVELIGARPVDWLGVPLIVNDHVIGILATQSYSHEIHFSQKDAEFLSFVSTQIAQAIELKRVEEAQHLSEIRYRYLFEDSPVSIWEEDFSEVKTYLDGLKKNGVIDFKKFFDEHPEEIKNCISKIKVIDVNQEALKLTGAKSKADLFSQLKVIFDPAQATNFLQEILNIAEGKTKFEWEGVNRTLHGDPLYVSVRWTAVDGYEETLSKVIISFFDISKRKMAEAELLASEERYRNLVDNLGEGIVIIDQNTTFLFANPSANMIFGMEKGTLELTRLNDFIRSDSLEFVSKQVNLLQTNESNTFELEIIRKDGEHRFIQIFARPQFDHKQSFMGLFGIIHDITDRKKAEEKRIARSQFEEMLTNISTRFINVDNEDIDNEINSVLKHIGQFEAVDRTYVFRIDANKKTMSNTHEWCRDGIAPKMSEMQNIPTDEFPWFIEQITCDPLIINHIKEMPESAAKERILFEKHGIRSLANFPMWVNLELIGFIGFDSVKKEHIWDQENAAMLQQFANIVSNAIERSRLLKILKDRAIRDELTKVLNRRGFLQIANTEMVRAHRYNHPVGMILLDMDHLKRVNDTYGHAAGDLALQEIARHCVMNIRGIDVLGRWGGDEFVILLPESDRESTINVAKRLQKSISDHTVRILGNELTFTISAGVALAEEDVTTIDELFRNADTALYLAKEAGRNRIMIFDPVDQTTLHR